MCSGFCEADALVSARPPGRAGGKFRNGGPMRPGGRPQTRGAAPLLTASVLLCLTAAACSKPEDVREQPTVEETRGVASTVKMSDTTAAPQLLRGFYGLEGNSWRWTAKTFAVVLGIPPQAAHNGAQLVLKFNLPEPSAAALKQVTLSARVGSVDLAPETYSKSENYEYLRDVPTTALTKDHVEVDFALDKAYTAPNDARQLGLVVRSVGLESK